MNTIKHQLLPKGFIITIAIIGATFFVGYHVLLMSSEDQVKQTEYAIANEQLATPTVMSAGSKWKNIDFYERRLPQNVDATHVAIKSRHVLVKGIEAFCREAFPPPSVEYLQQDVLLLHGQAFSSKTWVELKTMSTLAALGYRVLATDLPGFGESPTYTGSKAEYLRELVAVLELKKVVVVSPSMSGSYSIPFIEQHWPQLGGFVPVAPINTHSLTTTAVDIQLPTLIIYGEKDFTLGVNSAKDLQHISTSQTVVLPGARHPAYLDQPTKFHTLLYNFIEAVRLS